MMKNKNNELEKITLLEKQLSQKLGVYKDFKNSENNERYFANLHYKAMSKMDVLNSKSVFSFNPAIGYAMLFLISFTVSFQLMNFGDDDVKINNESYFFSETTLWLEEKEYLANIIDEDVDLNYVSYMNSELNYTSNVSFFDEMNQLSESELDEIYKNIKLKKNIIGNYYDQVIYYN